jgi:hypothetical protein
MQNPRNARKAGNQGRRRIIRVRTSIQSPKEREFSEDGRKSLQYQDVLVGRRTFRALGAGIRISIQDQKTEKNLGRQE